MEIYFICMLQVKYIKASTGEPVGYSCAFIQWLQQVHTAILNVLIWSMKNFPLEVYQCHS